MWIVIMFPTLPMSFCKLLLYYFNLMSFLICHCYQSVTNKTNGIDIYQVSFIVICCLLFCFRHCVPFCHCYFCTLHWSSLLFTADITHLSICRTLSTWFAGTTVTTFFSVLMFWQVALPFPHSAWFYYLNVLCFCLI